MLSRDWSCSINWSYGTTYYRRKKKRKARLSSVMPTKRTKTEDSHWPTSLVFDPDEVAQGDDTGLEFDMNLPIPNIDHLTEDEIRFLQETSTTKPTLLIDYEMEVDG